MERSRERPDIGRMMASVISALCPQLTATVFTISNTTSSVTLFKAKSDSKFRKTRRTILVATESNQPPAPHLGASGPGIGSAHQVADSARCSSALRPSVNKGPTADGGAQRRRSIESKQGQRGRGAGAAPECVFSAGLAVTEYVPLPDIVAKEPAQSTGPSNSQTHYIHIDKLDSSGSNLGIEPASSRANRAADALPPIADRRDAGAAQSTGSSQPSQSLAQALVIAYLSGTSQAFSGRPIRVYVFSRAQPEYLFARSKKNPNKNAIGGSALLRWWARTLDCLEAAVEYPAPPNPESRADPPSAVFDSKTTQKFAYTPNQARDQNRWLRSRRLALPQVADFNLSEYVYGTPFPDNIKSGEIVPLFCDDVLTRFVAERQCADMHVPHLLEMLSLGEECASGHQTALFFMDLLPSRRAEIIGQLCTAAQRAPAGDGAAGSTGPFRHAAAVKTESYIVTELQFLKISEFLFDRSTDYSCLDVAIKSTSAFTAFIRDFAPESCAVCKPDPRASCLESTGSPSFKASLGSLLATLISAVNTHWKSDPGQGTDKSRPLKHRSAAVNVLPASLVRKRPKQ